MVDDKHYDNLIDVIFNLEQETMELECAYYYNLIIGRHYCSYTHMKRPRIKEAMMANRELLKGFKLAARIIDGSRQYMTHDQS